jgi:uncharacterized membrane protein YeaQ/YmgE (transglycosylase-associated protein family)
MGILLWIVFGLLAGSVARWIMPGPDRMGVIATILLGVAGAVLGGAIGSAFGSVGVMGFDFRSFLMAIIGALAVLFCYRSFAMRATT